MRVMVTGANGFIGRHLVPALAGAGHVVYALVRRPDQVPAQGQVTVVECDLSRPLEDSRLPEADAIVHLAQANVAFPDHANELYRVNTVSTQELLDFGRRTGCQRFVYASSGAVYGWGDQPFRESAPLLPHNFYAVTKINGEQMVGTYAPYFHTAILRFFAPYGPGQQGRMIPGLITRVRTGQPVVLNGGGRPRMNPIYVDDAVRAIQGLLALDGHHILNVGGDEARDIRELAELIAGVLGAEPRFQPGSGEVPGDLVGDNTRLHEVLKLAPLTSLREGLRQAAKAV